ncbi:MAG: hypothetical protein JW732_07065 [Dehalococcoidia bacterium]|nr:hypothetical protein [Dehalococcoidia bacterium]
MQKKLKPPSLKTIIHIAVTEFIVNAIWYGITKLASIQSVVRDWGFLVVFVIVIIVVGLYLGKRGYPKIETGEQDAQKQKNTMEIQSSRWLNQIIEDDKSNLAKHIHIKPPIEWFTNLLYETEPSMQAIFGIVNANCFPVVIIGARGSLNIQGLTCNYEIKKEGQTRILHGESAPIRLTQRVTRETVDKMIALTNDSNGFMVDFNSCQLLIQPELPNEVHEPIKIGLGIREQLKL